MRGTQTHIGKELVFEFALEVREGRTDNQAAQGVPDEGHLREALDRAELLDVLLHLVRQALTHLKDISFGEVLIGLAREEDSFWVGKTEIVLEKPHIAGVPLEPVAQHEQMHTSIHDY